tara:strand:+ start:74 stop:367 length:294 start_codon:yes stop_codon:yes gene_type:complete
VEVVDHGVHKMQDTKVHVVEVVYQSQEKLILQLLAIELQTLQLLYQIKVFLVELRLQMEVIMLDLVAVVLAALAVMDLVHPLPIVMLETVESEKEVQ